MTDQRFGQIAISRGFLTASQLDAALRLQKEIRAADPKRFSRLGYLLAKAGYITNEQVLEVLEAQGVSMQRCEKCRRQYNVRNADTGRNYLCPADSSTLERTTTATLKSILVAMDMNGGPARQSGGGAVVNRMVAPAGTLQGKKQAAGSAAPTPSRQVAPPGSLGATRAAPSAAPTPTRQVAPPGALGGTKVPKVRRSQSDRPKPVDLPPDKVALPKLTPLASDAPETPPLPAAASTAPVETDFSGLEADYVVDELFDDLGEFSADDDDAMLEFEIAGGGGGTGNPDANAATVTDFSTIPPDELPALDTGNFDIGELDDSDQYVASLQLHHTAPDDLADAAGDEVPSLKPAVVSSSSLADLAADPARASSAIFGTGGDSSSSDAPPISDAADDSEAGTIGGHDGGPEIVISAESSRGVGGSSGFSPSDYAATDDYPDPTADFVIGTSGPLPTNSTASEATDDGWGDPPSTEQSPSSVGSASPSGDAWGEADVPATAASSGLADLLADDEEFRAANANAGADLVAPGMLPNTYPLESDVDIPHVSDVDIPASELANATSVSFPTDGEPPMVLPSAEPELELEIEPADTSTGTTAQDLYAPTKELAFSGTVPSPDAFPDPRPDSNLEFEIEEAPSPISSPDSVPDLGPPPPPPPPPLNVGALLDLSDDGANNAGDAPDMWGETETGERLDDDLASNSSAAPSASESAEARSSDEKVTNFLRRASDEFPTPEDAGLFPMGSDTDTETDGPPGNDDDDAGDVLPPLP